MKNIKSGLTAWIALLVVCLLPLGAQATEHNKSGIIGVLETGGSLAATGWVVTVVSESGNYITVLQPDIDGFFEVDLIPGDYVLTPFYAPHPGPGQPLPNFVILGPATTVTVAKHHFTFVELPTSFQFPLPPAGG
jgi:hypothetical protein